MTAAARAPWRSRIVGHAEVAPGDLVPNPRNWRTHPPEQQRALAGALGEVGRVAEVLVNRTTGNVVDGHLRIELALARQEPTVPVTYLELTEAEERLVLATLDPIGAMTDAEATALALLLSGLEPTDDALRALLDDLTREQGIDLARSGLVDPDDAPDLPDEPTVRRGDLYALGDHRLLCGDATDPADVRRVFGDTTEADMMWTDPPYGVACQTKLSTEEAAAEAPRLGGLRRRREKAVSGAYDFEGLDSVQAIRRILEIATLDALGLENSIIRARVLISAALAAAKLLETGELEARIESLEAAIGVGRGRELEVDPIWP